MVSYLSDRCSDRQVRVMFGDSLYYETFMVFLKINQQIIVISGPTVL